jgi:hypothetical protein
LLNHGSPIQKEMDGDDLEAVGIHQEIVENGFLNQLTEIQLITVMDLQFRKKWMEMILKLLAFIKR